MSVKSNLIEIKCTTCGHPIGCGIAEEILEQSISFTCLCPSCQERNN